MKTILLVANPKKSQSNVLFGYDLLEEYIASNRNLYSEVVSVSEKNPSNIVFDRKISDKGEETIDISLLDKDAVYEVCGYDDDFSVLKLCFLLANEGFQFRILSNLVFISDSQDDNIPPKTQAEMNQKITEDLEHVSHETRQMQKKSEETFQMVEAGNQMVNSLHRKANDVSAVNKASAELVEELTNAMESVKDITDAILGISKQTNLLSLNASIEAARAGDAGRGFAVVASEIRSLSDSTKESAEQIGKTIEELTDKIHAASNNMQKSVEITDEETDLIGKTEEEFNNISESVTSLTKRINKITEQVENLSNSNAEIMDAISTLSATSEEVAASSESSLATTEECKKEMQKAKELMDSILLLTQECGENE